MEGIRQRYKTYLEEYHALQRRRKFGDGMLGMARSPERELCHARFAEDARALLEGPEGEKLSAGEAYELLRFVYFFPLEQDPDSEAYWMLLAVHGMTQGLIRRLDPPRAGALQEEYSRAYPRRRRLPAQDEVLTALKRQSGK